MSDCDTSRFQSWLPHFPHSPLPGAAHGDLRWCRSVVRDTTKAVSSSILLLERIPAWQPGRHWPQGLASRMFCLLEGGGAECLPAPGRCPRCGL